MVTYRIRCQQSDESVVIGFVTAKSAYLAFDKAANNNEMSGGWYSKYLFEAVSIEISALELEDV